MGATEQRSLDQRRPDDRPGERAGAGADRELPPVIPAERVRALGDAPVRPERAYVLYWMTAFRRPRYNFALQHAAGRARALAKPLVVFEPLRCGYRWASVRLHRFILEGMSDNARSFDRQGVRYVAYLERRPGEGSGLLARLARDAALVVGDDYPCFFLPRMLAAAARQLDVRLEAVDANGLLPMRSTDRCFETAYAFRRFVQHELPRRLEEFPAADPLGGLELPNAAPLAADIFRRWPLLRIGDRIALADLPIDQRVGAVSARGGWRAGRRRWRRFVERRLDRYGDRKNRDPEGHTSGISPYLHFGQLSAHEAMLDLLQRYDWSPAQLDPAPRGSRTGYWGLPEAAEAFVDELVTWRELGFNRCVTDAHYDRYASLPQWARSTLEDHAGDPRPYLYGLGQLERARTHDPLWNAAQTQLLREGRIESYLRMLWGKKILHWTRSPREALEVMIELNNRYALDGRDPNSYSGIFWVLGRYDRPWGPERPIFGKVRYMSSKNTARKLRVADYIARYESTPGPGA